MTGRVYSVVSNAVSVSAVQDLVAVYAGSGMAFKVHSVTIGQVTATAVGNLKLSLKRLASAVTAGSGGTTPTPQPINPSDANATVTAHANDTTQASSSGVAVLGADAFNVINGYLYLPPAEDRIIVKPSQAFVVSLDSAPGTAETVSVTVVVEELF